MLRVERREVESDEVPSSQSACIRLRLAISVGELYIVDGGSSSESSPGPGH